MTNQPTYNFTTLNTNFTKTEFTQGYLKAVSRISGRISKAENPKNRKFEQIQYGKVLLRKISSTLAKGVVVNAPSHCCKPY